MNNYKLINEALSDIPNLKYDKKFKIVATQKNQEGEYEGSYSSEINVYDIGSDTFLKVEIRTDSYGENEFVHSIQIVKPITKTITDYESI